jgi:LysM repeat protein
VLAWTILSITLVTAGMKGSIHPAQATMRTASSTKDILTSTLTIAAPPMTASAPATTYVVQPGDTLSGIAARFAVRGGWPALYTLNLRVLGRDPSTIRPGTVLTVPGRAPVRYTVAAGDTLSTIAAGLHVPGGWPALYAANRRAIGRDPNTIRPGTVLTVPRRAAAPRPAGRGHRRHPAPSLAPAPPAAVPHHAQPGTRAVPAAQGMPQWLKTMLLGVGLLILVAFLVEPMLVARRRRQRQAVVQAAPGHPAGPGRVPGGGSGRWPGTTSVQATGLAPVQAAGSAPDPALPSAGQASAGQASIVLADHDPLVVTCNQRDDTVYVLRPPGADPKAILRVARLVLPEGRYGELARQLGMPAIGPVE